MTNSITNTDTASRRELLAGLASAATIGTAGCMTVEYNVTLRDESEFVEGVEMRSNGGPFSDPHIELILKEVDDYPDEMISRSGTDTIDRKEVEFAQNSVVLILDDIGGIYDIQIIENERVVETISVDLREQ